LDIELPPNRQLLPALMQARGDTRPRIDSTGPAVRHRPRIAVGSGSIGPSPMQRRTSGPTSGGSPMA
jgi:hypothetical protein